MDRVDGKHPGESRPAPDVLQGSRWSGAVWLQGGDGEYQLESYTWTFPDGAVKGYGTFAERHERTGPGDRGSYWAFVGNPTGLKENAVAKTDHEEKYGYLKFTPDDLTKQSDHPSNRHGEVNDHVIDAFYWGPDAGAIGDGAEETVAVSATYVKVLNNEVVHRFTDEDQMTFNVIRPTGNIHVQTMNPAGVSDASRSTELQQFLSLSRLTPRGPGGHVDGSRPVPPTVGIHWSSTVDKKGKVQVGSFFTTQTEQQVERRSYLDKGRNTVIEQDGIFLDDLGNRVTTEHVPVVDALAYPGRVGDERLGEKASQDQPIGRVGDVLWSNDSPFSALAVFHSTTMKYWDRKDRFTDTVMFNPDPNPPALSLQTTDTPGGEGPTPPVAWDPKEDRLLWSRPVLGTDDSTDTPPPGSTPKDELPPELTPTKSSPAPLTSDPTAVALGEDGLAPTTTPGPSTMMSAALWDGPHDYQDLASGALKADDPVLAPPDSIWIPVGKLTWQWGVSADYDAAKAKWVESPLTYETPQSHDSYFATTTFPVWEKHIQDVTNNFQKI